MEASTHFSLHDGASERNNAFMVARLKPFADRKAAADSAIGLDFIDIQHRGGRYPLPRNLAGQHAPVCATETTLDASV
jgi:hypothetical protein